MELVPLKTVFGEGKSWEILSGLSPEEVCRNASATFDQTKNTYIIRSFGIDFSVSLDDRIISSGSLKSELFLGKLKDFFRLSILWYMTSAKNIICTDRLIRPLDVKGGQRFFTGTHVLPLDRIAERFGKDKEGFIRKGKEFGAEVVTFGDAAARLYPLPRVPITMILWLEDEEFPPRVDLLFDSTCDIQISLSDIIWSVAIMTCLVMLE